MKYSFTNQILNFSFKLRLKNCGMLLNKSYLVFINFNSVQEAYAKCFAVHILEFEIFQISWNKWNKKHQTLSFQLFINKSSISIIFVLFFHVVCKISSYNVWTAKHLAQVSCTELTLPEKLVIEIGKIIVKSKFFWALALRTLSICKACC